MAKKISDIKPSRDYRSLGTLTKRQYSDEENFRLLENDQSKTIATNPLRLRFIIIILLMIFNVVSVITILFSVLKTSPSSTNVIYPPQPTWAPPQIPITKIFQNDTLFGQEPNEESIAAWNSLLPKGRGWIMVKKGTALPEMPGLNQSMPEHIALPSVYHQLHCLYSTMRSYYDLLDLVNAKGTQKREVPKDPGWNRKHLNHCWDYLRQNIMCNADLTLEWQHYNEKAASGWGYEHQCKDWDAIMDFTFEHRPTNNWGLLRGEGERKPLDSI